MAVREMMTIGNPVLRAPARPLEAEEIVSEEIQTLVEDMVDTMHELDGVGIAAPQVGESIQLAVVEIAVESSRYPDEEEFTLEVFINPRITVVDETEQGFWEGCLSVPNLRGYVERPRKVQVEYTRLDGDECVIVAEDFLATVLQHELDHLDGRLFLDRVRDTTKIATVEDYQRYWLEEPTID